MIAAETEGRAVIDTMNAMGYDAMVIGNHEPDFTAEGGHNYNTFKRGRERREVGKQFEMIKSWIAARGNVAAPPTDRIPRWEARKVWVQCIIV